MTEEKKLTYEQLEFRLGVVERSLKEAQESFRNERAENKRLRLILRGMTDEQFTLKVHIDQQVLSPDAWDAVQWMLKNYVGQTAHAIEEKLGGPLRRLQEALMHINYLENHATSRGLPFTPWEVRESDKWLHY